MTSQTIKRYNIHYSIFFSIKIFPNFILVIGVKACSTAIPFNRRGAKKTSFGWRKLWRNNELEWEIMTVKTSSSSICYVSLYKDRE